MISSCTPSLIHITLVLVGPTLLGACQAPAQTPADGTAYEFAVAAVERQLEGVPVHELSLDCCAATTMVPAGFIGTDQANAGAEPFLGASKSLALVGDSVLVADYRQDRVLWAHQEDRVFARAFGEKGRGPGEFVNLEAAALEAGHLFALDATAAGIHVFDGRNRYLRTLETRSPIWLSFAAGGGLVAHAGASHLIEVREATPPFSLAGSLLSRLDDHGPDGFDSPVIAMNGLGEIVAGYYGIPMLFLFDRDRSLRTGIILRSARLLDLAASTDDSRIHSWLFGLALSDTGDIALSTSDGTFLIGPDTETYTVRSHLKLLSGADSEEILTPFGLAFSEDGDVLWAVSRSSSRVFRYDLGPP